MGWIRERIRDEKRKHGNMPFGEEKYNLDWAKLAESKIIMAIMEQCYKNNTIKFKDTDLRLAVTDGGWVNVMELRTFLEGKESDANRV